MTDILTLEERWEWTVGDNVKKAIEIESLQLLNASKQGNIEILTRMLNRAQKEVESLQAQNDELRDALKPLAELTAEVLSQISASDILRARELLITSGENNGS